MSKTYEDREKEANRDSLVDKYYLLEEHTRRAVSHPRPFNVIYFILELITFLYHDWISTTTKEKIKNKNADCSTFQRFLMYLSRNFRYSDSHEDSESTVNFNHFVALYERARTFVLEEEDLLGDKVLVEKLHKVQEDVSNVLGAAEAGAVVLQK